MQIWNGRDRFRYETETDTVAQRHKNRGAQDTEAKSDSQDSRCAGNKWSFTDG